MERENISKFQRGYSLECFFLFVLLFSCDFVEGVGESKNSTSKANCKEKDLDKCFVELPQLPPAGIPTSWEEIDKACNAFTVGMKCVNDYIQECFSQARQEQIRKSYSGAHETFQNLCFNEEFRKEYKKHSLCYKSVSAKWDNCALRFYEILKSLKNISQNCCAKFSFLKCIAKIVHLKCTKEGAKFLQGLAEQVVLSEIGKQSKVTELYCHNKEAQCADIAKLFASSDGSEIKNWTLLTLISLSFYSFI